METSTRIQGRPVTEQDLRLIRQLLADHPDWHRTRLSQELCRHWDWINARGSYKDMAARALLRKLHARGLIALPAPVRCANNGFRHRRPVALAVDQTPIAGRLRELLPVRVEPVATPGQAQLFRWLLQAHHYLGYGGPVGENRRYLAWDRHERPLAQVRHYLTVYPVFEAKFSRFCYGKPVNTGGLLWKPVCRAIIII